VETIKYNGKFIRVSEKKIDQYTWEKVYLPDSLVVIPLTDDNEIIFIVEQRPHETPNFRLKLVTGHIEKNESPIETANRELQEEAGYKSHNLTELMVHRSTGTINSHFYYFFARDLVPSKIPNPDGEESILEVKKFKVETVQKMLKNGELEWNLSSLGLFKVFDLLDFSKS
jgi:8-oxo-dGTP pyrophosphatase MutT (NUDIX family)